MGGILSLRLMHVSVASLCLHYACVYACVSVCACVCQEKTVRLLRSLSAGAVLGVGVCHTLVDSSSDLSIVVPQYPLANALTIAGIILVLALELVRGWARCDTSAAEA